MAQMRQFQAMQQQMQFATPPMLPGMAGIPPPMFRPPPGAPPVFMQPPPFLPPPQMPSHMQAQGQGPGQDPGQGLPLNATSAVEFSTYQSASSEQQF